MQLRTAGLSVQVRIEQQNPQETVIMRKKAKQDQHCHPAQQTSAHAFISVKVSTKQWCHRTFLTLLRQSLSIHISVPQTSRTCRSHQVIPFCTPQCCSFLRPAKTVQKITFMNKAEQRCCPCSCLLLTECFGLTSRQGIEPRHSFPLGSLAWDCALLFPSPVEQGETKRTIPIPSVS